MRDQRVIFTPLPNGIVGDTLHLSVLVSPRLRTDEGLVGLGEAVPLALRVTRTVLSTS